MIPLRDVNPTARTALTTLALIAACAYAWVGWQQEPQRSSQEDLVFNIENAAIPCEVVEGRPLTIDELRASFGELGVNGAACGLGSPSSPAAVPDKPVWLALLASMFMHGSLMHIGGNMLFLWIFGNNIEDHLGRVRYLLFYVAAGLAAAATHIALQPDSTIPVVGASGAVAGVMGAYLVWFPDAPVRSIVLLGFPLFLTIRAKWLLGFWFVTQFFTSPNSGVAWAAHVGGFVFGALVGLVVRSSPRAQQAAWRRDRQWTGGWDTTGGVGPYHEHRRWRS